ncbi:MAG TPA: biotin--[acetyl-CoA-carboxylase] ligase [Ignavibacteriaceae bacterium]
MDKILFDISKFDIKLDTNFIGRVFFLMDEIDSTNTQLLSGKKIYKESGTVLLAEKQTSGKGRRERTWVSQKEQNLTFSILLTYLKSLKEKLNLINLASALSIAISIENLFQLKCEMKWPNDVLINRKKVSGILIETSILGKKIERIVIGMGINVNQNTFQGEFSIPPTSLKLELNKAVEREILLAEILNNFEEQLETVNENPRRILHDWKSRCRMIGDKITVQNDHETRTGIFEDLDNDGFMILNTKGKLEKIHYGDVSLL